MKLNIIIPNYNGLHFLAKCLPSLKAQTFRDFDVIIADNGSTDGSIDFIQSEYPEIKLLRHSRNRGFSAAVNAGICASEAPYIMLLNNDAVLACDCLWHLMSCMERHPGAFSVGARILSSSLPQQIDTCGDYYSVMGYAFCHMQGLPVSTAPVKTSSVFSNCACAAVYRRSMLEKTGLFDEHYFAYLEDVDIGFRARRLGFSNLHCPGAVVWHAGSGTTAAKYTDFKVFHSAKNNILLRKNNLTLMQKILHFPFRAAGMGMKAFFFRRRGFLNAYLSGCLAGIRTSSHINSTQRTLRESLISFWRTEPWIVHGTIIYIVQYIKRRIKR